MSPFIFQSQKDSAGSIQPFNNSIDTVHLELELPIAILLDNNTVADRLVQIKFWDINYGSYEAGLVTYLINSTALINSRSTQLGISIFNGLSSVWFFIGIVPIGAMGLIIYYIRVVKQRPIHKKQVLDKLQNVQPNSEKHVIQKKNICVKCHALIFPEDKFCQNCGTPIIRLD